MVDIEQEDIHLQVVDIEQVAGMGLELLNIVLLSICFVCPELLSSVHH